jgi:hypothetical protein
MIQENYTYERKNERTLNFNKHVFFFNNNLKKKKIFIYI